MRQPDTGSHGPVPSSAIPSVDWDRSARRRFAAEPAAFLSLAAREHGEAFRIGASRVVLTSAAATRTVLAREGRVFQGDGLLVEDPRTDPAVQAEWISARQAVQGAMTAAATERARFDAVLHPALGSVVTEGAGAHQLVEQCQQACALVMTQMLFRGLGASAVGLVIDTATAHVRLMEGRARPWTERRLARRLRHGSGRLRTELAAYLASDASADAAVVAAVRPLCDDETAAKVLATVVAGSHSIPGSSLAWLIVALAQNPDVARQARESTDTELFVGIARETLRLYPPAWLLVRRATADVDVDGWSVRAGDLVHVSPYLVQRDPRYWTQPDALDPHRWREPTAAMRAAYLPFGAGPRVCPALTFSEQLLSRAAAVLAARDLGVRRAGASFGPLLTPTVTGRSTS